MKKLSKLDLDKKLEIQEMKQVKAGHRAPYAKTKSEGGTTKSQSNDHDSAHNDADA